MFHSIFVITSFIAAFLIIRKGHKKLTSCIIWDNIKLPLIFQGLGFNTNAVHKNSIKSIEVELYCITSFMWALYYIARLLIFECSLELIWIVIFSMVSLFFQNKKCKISCKWSSIKTSPQIFNNPTSPSHPSFALKITSYTIFCSPFPPPWRHFWMIPDLISVYVNYFYLIFSDACSNDF